MIRRPPISTRTYPLFPYTTLFRSGVDRPLQLALGAERHARLHLSDIGIENIGVPAAGPGQNLAVDEMFYIAHIGNSCLPTLGPAERSEERRVGKECVSTCRSRWSPYH